MKDAPCNIVHGVFIMPRKSGPDIIRCTGFLLVVLFHFYLNNYFYSVPQTGAWVYLADFFRTLSISCNGLFITLTGYLMCEKEFDKRYFRRLPGILLAYYIAAAISIPVRHFLLNGQRTLTGWITAFFGFSGAYYGWYVEMYAGLLLISPVLNAAAKELDKNGKLHYAVLLCTAAVSLPQISPLGILPDWWKSFYPVVYYLIGTYIRKKQPKLKKLPLLLCAVILTAVTAAATMLSANEGLSSGFQPEFGDIEIVLTVVCLFLLLYDINAGKRSSRVFAFLAKGTFGGYLLSFLLDSWVYKLLRPLCTPSKYPLLFLCAGVPVFIVSILAGRLLARITSRERPHYSPPA